MVHARILVQVAFQIFVATAVTATDGFGTTDES